VCEIHLQLNSNRVLRGGEELGELRKEEVSLSEEELKELTRGRLPVTRASDRRSCNSLRETQVASYVYALAHGNIFLRRFSKNRYKLLHHKIKQHPLSAATLLYCLDIQTQRRAAKMAKSRFISCSAHT
jgi:hypothetical protein